MLPEREREIIADVRKYIADNLPLSSISDEELEEKTEELVRRRIGS
jgi:hypothetical protein